MVVPTIDMVPDGTTNANIVVVRMDEPVVKDEEKAPKIANPDILFMVEQILVDFQKVNGAIFNMVVPNQPVNALEAIKVNTNVI